MRANAPSVVVVSKRASECINMLAPMRANAPSVVVVSKRASECINMLAPMRANAPSVVVVSKRASQECINALTRVPFRHSKRCSPLHFEFFPKARGARWRTSARKRSCKSWAASARTWRSAATKPLNRGLEVGIDKCQPKRLAGRPIGCSCAKPTHIPPILLVNQLCVIPSYAI
jgi:hypothetical protein